MPVKVRRPAQFTRVRVRSRAQGMDGMGSYEVYAKQWGMDKLIPLDSLAKLYPPVELAPDMANLPDMPNTNLIADTNYHAPAFHLARSVSSVPNKQTGKTIPAYLYRCDTLPAELLKGREHLGVVHTGEIPFVLVTDYLWDEGDDDARTSDVMSRAWISFANTGSPGACSLLHASRMLRESHRRCIPPLRGRAIWIRLVSAGRQDGDLARFELAQGAP